MDDGTQIFMEQSSHHPPVSSWHVSGADKCYEFFGFVGYVATFRYNKFKVLHSGPRVIRFKDGAEITFDSPVDQCAHLFRALILCNSVTGTSTCSTVKCVTRRLAA
jgi:hypothetical protein